MSCKGMDLSNFQSGMDVGRVVRENGLDFVFVLSNDGTFRNVYFPAQVDAARNAGAIVLPYLYQRPNIEQTIDTHLSMIAGHGLVGSLVDTETGSGDITVTNRAHTLLHQAGRSTPLAYFPKFYWQEVGSPDLSHLPVSGLWKSWYPDMTPRPFDDGVAMLPARVWDPYGGLSVRIVQFTSTGQLSGYSRNVDLNYFPGSRDELAALLGGDDMATPDEVADAVLNRLLGAPGYWSQTTLGGAALTLWTAMYGDATGAQGLSDNSVVGMLKQLTRQLPTSASVGNVNTDFKADVATYARNADGYGYDTQQKLAELKTLVQAVSTPTVDVEALSTALAAKLNEQTSALTPDEIQAVAAATATAVADEEAKRLAS